MEKDIKAKNFDDVLKILKNNTSDNFIIIEDDKSIFDTLLVQNLKRLDKNFIAIRSVTIKKEFRHSGLFEKFVIELEKMNKDIMFYDIVNPKLYQWCVEYGYETFNEEKYGYVVDACYRLKR
jgi:N-acetylglutamate synthase-like GNAT family acetyltransferase